MIAFVSSALTVRSFVVAAVVVLLALAVLVSVLAADAQRADARTRTIHPCLLGDEPCNTPAPTPNPR